ncbi:MAG: hypothetical protein P0S93_04010 [Candidatus Neptunochlamydia sp.]|nr:hypothetical protein [Candidatus Neptunochlamydia sp.]
MQLTHPEVEGVMQASKWLSHRALLDVREMEALFKSLPHFSIYNVSELVDLEDAIIPQEKFLSKYIDYVTSLKAGLIPNEKELKPYFSAALSCTSDSLYAMEAKEGKCIIKPKEPVVQLSLHHFTFSEEHNAFHSMVHSKRAVTWGIQFAFPQLYSNSIKNDIVEVYKNSEFPNTELFKTLAKWMRGKTTPPPFKVGDLPINATFRLGKECKSWIHAHAQLEAVGLSV